MRIKHFTFILFLISTNLFADFSLTYIKDFFDESMKHNGYSYKAIKSPHTGRVWIDRNIGASRVCRNRYDEKCFGSYFQWGRFHDGHEEPNSNITATQLASYKSTSKGKFIESDVDYSLDWAHEYDALGNKRSNHWKSLDGSSICPKGFRVPIIQEIEDETINVGVKNNVEAFESFLKIPSAGIRKARRGLIEVNAAAGLWSNTYSEWRPDVYRSSGIGFAKSYAGSTNNLSRTDGVAVRCIKD